MQCDSDTWPNDIHDIFGTILIIFIAIGLYCISGFSRKLYFAKVAQIFICGFYFSQKRSNNGATWFAILIFVNDEKSAKIAPLEKTTYTVLAEHLHSCTRLPVSIIFISACKLMAGST